MMHALENSGSTHSYSDVRRTIRQNGSSTEEELWESANFQDVRVELNATGHNLTSVLINPRETIFDHMFDEFAAEQSLPLEYESPLAQSSTGTISLAMSLHSSSSHMHPAFPATPGSNLSSATATTHSTNSSHFSSGSSAHSAVGSGFGYNTVFSLTKAELRDLDGFVDRMQRIFNLYTLTHGEGDRAIHSSGESRTKASGTLRISNEGTSPRYTRENKLRDRSAGVVGTGESAAKAVAGRSPRGRDAVVAAGISSRSRKLAADDMRICYREVPDLFFRAEFSLQRQDVFNLVLLDMSSQGTSTSSGNSSSGAAATARDAVEGKRGFLEMLSRKEEWHQDKLAHYLDLVEVALLRQIWMRSPAFFRALDDIRGLQFEVSEATSQLRRVRASIKQSAEGSVASALSIPKMRTRQRNAQALQDTLICMQQVLSGRLAILALLEIEDYLAALELISSARRLFHEKKLGAVQCMRSLGNQLDDFDNLVCEVMCNKFVSLAIQWEEEQGVGEGSRGDGSERVTVAMKDEGIDMGYDEMDGGATAGAGAGSVVESDGRRMDENPAEASLKQLLVSLLTSERIQSALNMYKNRVLEAIRLVVRTCVMEYLSQSAYFDPNIAYNDADDMSAADTGNSAGSGNDTPFAQRVREMGADSFVSCLSMCYEHLALSLTKAETFHQFLHSHLLLQHEEHLDRHRRRRDQLEQQGQQGLNGQIVAGKENVYVETHFPVERDSTLGHSGGSCEAGAASRIRGIIPKVGSFVLDSSSSGVLSPHGGADGSAGLKEEMQYSPEEERDLLMRRNMVALSKNSLSAACDLAQRSVAQLINLRKDANARLGTQQMKRLWESSLRFVLLVERVSGSTAYVLRQCLLAQTKAFLEYLHEACKGRMVNTLDSERWVQCDVSAERQEAIDRLASGKAFLPLAAGSGGSNASETGTPVGDPAGVGTPARKSAEVAGKGYYSTPEPSSAGTGVRLGSSTAGAPSTGRMQRSREIKPVMVPGNASEFKVVWSVLLLTEIALTYLEVAHSFAPITPDVIAKIVELFRLFDSRTRSLVLGAQAIQSAARLKSISAKHLAITGQSLNLILALLPHIRAALLAQVPQKHHMLLTGLDRVSQELIEHHQQIVSKFVGIVGDFVDASSAKLRVVDWDRFQGLGQCEYFEEVQKNVTALHRVLQTILPTEQIEDVFSRIFALLGRKIPAHFDEVMPVTQTGRQRILDEVTHLVSAFSRLRQIDSAALTTSLEDAFRKKYARAMFDS